VTQLRTVVSGLAMGESPRWHDGRLWFSDMGTKVVTAVDLDGGTEVVAEVPGMPMGLGWLPDGTMLIVSSDGRLLQRGPDGVVSTRSDLTGLSRFPWSDMVVDGRGNAYIGNIGFDFSKRDGQPVAGPHPGTVALVSPDGTARIVADDTAFPNGMAVTPDNATLIVAESYANRLTAFDIDPGGGLSNRRLWADLGDGVPDGIWLDEQAVWYADVPNQRCVLVREGGEVLRTLEADRGCFACTLGGPDGRTLFVMAARWPDCMQGGERTGQVLAVDL
jgi:sugar lactone lactonase YvrE